ncbi:MAG: restriction endonuclease subunit S [Prevotellaceae bacterium]|nr:restriction endonuclease subunit S [Prevotellaceae bacterium]
MKKYSMEEWKEYRLGDIISISGGFAYKGELIGSGDNYLLSMGCVSFSENFLDKGARQYAGESPDRFYAYPGDIVLATRQQSDNLPILGMPAIIPSKYEGHKMIVGANLYRVDIKDKSFNNRFLYWLLKTPSYVNHIRSCQSGTTVRMITKANIEDYIFYAPDKTTRDHISDFIWALDDKIEVNRKINENLEQQAQALFKSWFVDFEPFKNGEFVESELGMIPKGWRVEELENICTIKYGKGLGKNDLTQKGFPVFGGNGIIGFYTQYLYELPQILVSCRGAASGKIIESLPKSYVSSNSLVLELKDRFYYNYLKFLLLSSPLYDYATGSAQPQITIDNIKGVKILLPLQEAIQKMNPTLENIGNIQRTNEQESHRIAELRDTLLPKLMSGELKVNEVENSL